MPKSHPKPLSMRERMLLFCVASGVDWQNASITSEAVTAMVVRGMVSRDNAGRLSLTGTGRAALRTLIPSVF